MILGQLSAFKNLLRLETKEEKSEKITKRIRLSQLEVIQCFHVSPGKNREAILTYGLVPTGKPEGWYGSEKITYGPRIFLSTIEEEIAFDHVGYENVDVWMFYLPKHLLHADEHSEYANHYYITEAVPWYKLNLIETI